NPFTAFLLALGELTCPGPRTKIVDSEPTAKPSFYDGRTKLRSATTAGAPGLEMRRTATPRGLLRDVSVRPADFSESRHPPGFSACNLPPGLVGTGRRH